MGTEAWSTTPGSNNSAPPNGWPEGQAASTVNDCARQMMASLRTQLEDAQWFNFGHVPTRVDADTFTVPTDLTALYHAGRRLKVDGTGPGYCTVASSSYSAPDMTVNVTMDSGNLPVSLTTVYLSNLTATNGSIPLIPLTGGGTGATTAAAARTALGIVANIVKYKTAQTARNTTTTLADDDHLIASAVPAGTYRVRVKIWIQAIGASGFKFAFRVGGTFSGTKDVSVIAIINNATDIRPTIGIASTTAFATVSTTSLSDWVDIETIFTTTTTGDIALQWAQNSSNGSNTIVQDRSYMEIQQLS